MSHHFVARSRVGFADVAAPDGQCDVCAGAGGLCEETRLFTYTPKGLTKVLKLAPRAALDQDTRHLGPTVRHQIQSWSRAWMIAMVKTVLYQPLSCSPHRRARIPAVTFQLLTAL